MRAILFEGVRVASMRTSGMHSPFENKTLFTILIAVLLGTMDPARVSAQTCNSNPNWICLDQPCDVFVYPYRWCTGSLRMAIPYYFIGNAWNVGAGPQMRSAVEDAVFDWNFLTGLGYEIPIYLVYGGTAPGPSDYGIFMEYTSATPGSDNEYGSVDYFAPDALRGEKFYRLPLKLTANPPIAWGDGEQNTVCRRRIASHEIGHALGLGHTCCSDVDCVPRLMYSPTIPSVASSCPDVDDGARVALECKYGNMKTSPCGWYSDFSVAWHLAPCPITLQRHTCVEIKKGLCTGCIGVCAPPSQESAEREQLPVRQYELSVSSQGGPFQLIATLSDGDWVNDTYVYGFESGVTDARLQMRVLDGSPVGAARTDYSLTIPQPVSVDWRSAESQGVALNVFPIPSLRGVHVRIDLARDAVVGVEILDLAGRILSVVKREERLSPGVSEYRWDGLDTNGHPVKPGAYYCLVTHDGESTTRRLVLLR